MQNRLSFALKEWKLYFYLSLSLSLHSKRLKIVCRCQMKLEKKYFNFSASKVKISSKFNFVSIQYLSNLMYISSPNSPHRFLPESTSASYDENGLDFSAKKFHTVQNLLNCISFFSSFSLAPSLLSSFDFSLTLLSVCLLFK